MERTSRRRPQDPGIKSGRVSKLTHYRIPLRFAGAGITGLSGYQVTNWYCFVAPAATPRQYRELLAGPSGVDGRITTRPDNLTEPLVAEKNLKDLFLHTLKDVYFAENEILKALPEMAAKVRHAKLRKALEDHRAETEG